MSKRFITMAVLLAALCITGLAAAAANLELIIDASGSMATKIDGRSKMEIAKQALNELLFTLPRDTNIAVRAYGHRRKGDCGDIQLIANFGEARASISSKVNVLQPLGQTPLAASIQLAAKDFSGREGQDNTLVLITDGEETCHGNPCEVAKMAHQAGIKVKINVIGFKVDPKERAQLECIAEQGGGRYVAAANATELSAATTQVTAVATVAPTAIATVPPPAATPAPTPDRNILAAANGGQLLVAPTNGWTATNDGKEEFAAELGSGQEAVYAFKDEQPATFDRFATLVAGATELNLREFELLAGDESPTGTFRSIGSFTVQNAKMLKTPYQEFKFDPVTAKYLKVKLISNYGYPGGQINVAEFKVTGQTNVKGPADRGAKAPTEKKAGKNILAAANGGQLLIAPTNGWTATNDGKEEFAAELGSGQEAVYAFKDEQPATFDRFATLVAGATELNLREFELLAGDESPTGTFRSIGSFTVQNAKMLKTPYQEFKFDPVTAKYLKVKLISNYGYPGGQINVAEFKVYNSGGE